MRTARGAPLGIAGCQHAGLGSLPRAGISVRGSEFVARRCSEQGCPQLQAGSVYSPELKLLAKI